MLGSYLKKYFLTQTTFEEIQFYRLLQFISFVRSSSESGKKEILNDQLYMTVQFQLVDFMKALQVNINTYQRKQLLQFFDDSMGLPPYYVQFSDQKFRKLLFFPVVNAIQQTKTEPLGSLSKAWFESCHFIETNFNGFDFGSLIATAVEDSIFSKFNKSIEFKGKFFLIDILQSETGLEGMLLEH